MREPHRNIWIPFSVGERTYEAISFLQGFEPDAYVSEMLRRTCEGNSGAIGEEDEEYIWEHRNELPAKLRGKKLATNRRYVWDKGCYSLGFISRFSFERGEWGRDWWHDGYCCGKDWLVLRRAGHRPVVLRTEGRHATLIGSRKLELVPVLRGKEEEINRDAMFTRAIGEDAFVGDEMRLHLLEHAEDIPEKWQSFNLLLPDWRVAGYPNCAVGFLMWRFQGPWWSDVSHHREHIPGGGRFIKPFAFIREITAAQSAA